MVGTNRQHWLKLDDEQNRRGKRNVVSSAKMVTLRRVDSSKGSMTEPTLQTSHSWPLVAFSQTTELVVLTSVRFSRESEPCAWTSGSLTHHAHTSAKHPSAHSKSNTRRTHSVQSVKARCMSHVAPLKRDKATSQSIFVLMDSVW